MLHKENILEDAFAILEQAGFDSAELDEVTIKTCFFNNPSGNYTVNEYLKYPDSDSSLKKIQSLCLKHNVRISQMHAPAPLWNMEEQKKRIRILSGISDTLGCRTIVIHPYTGKESDAPKTCSGSYNAKDWSAYYKWLFEQTAGMLELICAEAKKSGVRIALENQIDAKGFGGRWIGGHPADMENLFDSIENLGLNLDTAHACAQQLDIPSVIQWAGGRLFGLHISDSDGSVRDYHLTPGKGTLDWKKIMAALFKSPYDGDFNLEIVNERKETFGLSAATAREAKATVDNLLNLGNI